MEVPPVRAVESYLDGAARLIAWPGFTDDRGLLVPVEFPDLPFVPVRMFTISGVPAGGVRGQHGHEQGSQLLTCANGTVTVDLRRGELKATVTLRDPGHALHIGPGVWAQQTYDGPDTVLVVLSSHPYQPSSYRTEPD